MVSEILFYGAENARTGRALAKQLNCNIRTVTEQIERERREGAPICANMTGENAGYYLAENPEDLQRYCDLLYKRGGELFKTRRALLSVLNSIKKRKGQEENG